MNNPQLRMDIQPVPVTVGKRRMISFHDPLSLAEDSLALDLGTVPLLQLLDGSRGMKDIQAELVRMERWRNSPSLRYRGFYQYPGRGPASGE